MSVFDLPLRLLSNLPIIGGSGGRDEEERDEGPVDDGDEDVAAADDHDEEPADDVADAPAAADDEPDGEDGGDDAGGDDEDISDITAPSVGPHTTFEKDDPEERLARHDQSDVDAMGLNKRREVIGGRYSASVTRQLTTYGIVIAVMGAIFFGLVLLTNKLDQAPDKYQDKAPWSQADAKQIKPTEIDFPNYGHPGPGESSQSTPGQSSGSSTSGNVAESQD